MKKTFLSLISITLSAVFLISCGKSDKKSTENESEDYVVVDDESSDYSIGSSYSSSVSTDDDETSNTTFSESSSDEDWDDILNSYEKFANEYIALLKKAAKGDASALSKYTDYLQEAESFANKLNSASGNISSAQLARFNRIQQKIVSAASSVSINTSSIADHVSDVVDAYSSYLDDNDDDDDDNDDDDDDDDW